MKVTVVGAGKYGSTVVQRLAERDLAREVVMTDIVEGLALDMMQSRSLEGFQSRVIGANGYEETAGSDVCVITAGPLRPGRNSPATRRSLPARSTPPSQLRTRPSSSGEAPRSTSGPGT
jgi:malate/lactate dehydrogenase